MTQPQLNQRLTSMDASFLYFERKEAPLHIGGIHVFEGELPYEVFVEHIQARMHLLPRYQQKIIPAPFGVGHPTWERDPDFEVRKHILKATVDAPGDLDQLRRLTGRLQSSMLSRDKPLWEMYVVSGMSGNRSALITKVHHAMVDGVSGVDLLKIVLDMSPNPAPPPPPEKAVSHPRTDMTTNFIEGLLGSAEESMKSWNDFQKGLLNLTQTLLKEPSRPFSQSLGSLFPAMAAPVSLLPFNRANSGEQHLGWNEFSFAEARAIRAAIGGTVNDVMLTVLSGAMARYVELHGQKTSGRNLRVMVPVSMRQVEQRGALGNLVSVLPIEIPLDLPDPLERYSHLTKKTGTLKGARVAEGINVLTALMGTVPASMQALMGSLASTPVPPFNTVCTNVPGPQIPLYALGRKMIASYPYVPVGFMLGVSCAIFSYNQMLYFGVTADVNAMPDVDKFQELLNEAFVELREAAGVAPIQPLGTKKF